MIIIQCAQHTWVNQFMSYAHIHTFRDDNQLGRCEHKVTYFKLYFVSIRFVEAQQAGLEPARVESTSVHHVATGSNPFWSFESSAWTDFRNLELTRTPLGIRPSSAGERNLWLPA